ncbi:hypothetical protein CRUP_027459 [Coryphaenoides rupestris]|nr:hypothetical protein CRUP_027459 [Coryphaenoides rupestris]
MLLLASSSGLSGGGSSSSLLSSGRSSGIARLRLAAALASLGRDVSMECGGPALPDSLVLEIFLHLTHDAALNAGLTCRQWLAVSRDEFLWRELFYSYYRIPRSVPRHPASVSWYREFKRLYDCIPCEEVQTLTEHHDQVLHLAFSHRGHRFSSCSKDCTIKLWDTERPDGVVSLVHSSSMLHFNWAYTQFSQFNADDSLLLVSGVYLGPHQSHLISGNLHWIGNMTSCSVFWLNKAFQDIESENVNVVKRLFKIQNINASTVRTVMVAHCRRHDNPDLLLDYEAQSLARSHARARPPGGGANGKHQTLRFDLGGGATDSEEDGSEEEEGGGGGEEEEEDRLRRGQGLSTARLPQPSLSGLEHVLQGCRSATSAELQMEATVARMMSHAHTKAPDPSLLAPSDPGEGEDKTYLLFTTGSLTYSPHQIGIKRIMPDQMSTSGPVLGEERSSDEYLYVNSRAWPSGCVVSDPMSPPPIAEEIDLHVIDLKTLREEKTVLRSHKAYTPNDECFFIFLDVSRDFDKHGYIWDRHYNICLARLAHQDVVNCVAFSPTDQELLLSASDDATIKVWRSPRMTRLAQSPTRRRPRPLGLLKNPTTSSSTSSTTTAAAAGAREGEA